jgi:gamma-glutamyl:cysteine ligase YbdK (ATP-grasp superfamily)
MITLIMEAVNPCETLVSIYQTARRDIPEGRHLYNRRRENLKSHHVICVVTPADGLPSVHLQENAAPCRRLQSSAVQAAQPLALRSWGIGSREPSSGFAGIVVY